MSSSPCFTSMETTLEDILNLKKDAIVSYLRSHQQKISGNNHDIAVRALNFHISTFSINDSNPNVGKNVHCSLSDTRNIPAFEDLKCGWSSDHTLFPK